MSKPENVATLPADADTGFFRMPQSAFVSLLARKYAPIAFPAAAIVIAGGFVGAFFDMRAIILALMAVFILTPMLLAFLYFKYALSKGCMTNTLNHSICFSTHEIRVDILPRQFDDEEETKTVSYAFSLENVKKVSATASELIVHLSGSDNGFLWIPYSAFLSPDHLKHSLAILGDNRYADFARIQLPTNPNSP